MFYTGLCSVTFRGLSPQAIVEAAVKAQIDAIEWGGDVHVPPGDAVLAAEVRRMTESAGLRVSSYGSYYRAGCFHGAEAAFEAVLESARSLGAPIIRVWAGDKGSAETDETRFRAIAEDVQLIAARAEAVGIDIAFEFHGNTLTDTPESALRLLGEVNRPNVRCYWQTGNMRNVMDEMEAIGRLTPYLAHVHVFHYSDGHQKPLAEGREEWNRYIRALEGQSCDFYLLLEFVRGGSVDQLVQDAATLKALVKGATTGE